MKITLNPDEKIVKAIQDGLEKKGGYCPCRIAKTEDTKCMCLEFREQIENAQAGECHCGLYEVIVND